MKIEDFITVLGVKYGVTHTEEQRELIKEAQEGSVLSTSLPGTGKTSTIISVIHAMTEVSGIKPEKIMAMSFTRRSTYELEERYRDTCQKIGMKPRAVDFRTLDSFMRDIVFNFGYTIGLDSPKITAENDMSMIVQYVINFYKSKGQDIMPREARQIADIIVDADTTFAYSRKEVTSLFSFKRNTCTNYEDIMYLRTNIYKVYKASSAVPVRCLGLLALDILQNSPKVGEYYRKKYDKVIIDEVQDMSTLQLLIFANTANDLIAIGDVNQQIYGFRGASEETIETLKVMFPNIKRVNLTHSFRCSEEIAELARKVIRPNKSGGEEIKTIKNGGSVEFINDTSYNVVKSIVDMYQEFGDDMFKESKTLISYRNRFSAYQVIEHLYSAGVPVRMANYDTIMTMPILIDIFNLMHYALVDDSSEEFFRACLPFLPKLKRRKDDIEKLRNFMKRKDLKLFEVNYNYADQDEFNRLVDAVEDFVEYYDKKSMSSLFKKMFEMYWRNGLERDIYYHNLDINLLNTCIDVLGASMNYREFVKNEMAKKEAVLYNNSKNFGIECLTMHSAKGTEADQVFILDANDNILPNRKIMDKMHKVKALKELNKNIRNERSLLYVAVTRAKSRLVIQYMDELSELFSGCPIVPYDNDEFSRTDINQCLDDFSQFIQEGRII